MKWPLALVALLSGCASLYDVIPPKDNTRSAMTETSVRIGMYLEKNGHLPPDIKSLPIRPDHVNQTDDAWHRPLLYSVEPGNTVVLKSLGADGKPGGTGDDEDLTQRYRIENGRLAEVFDEAPTTRR
jgi:hypothetical protein